MTILKRKQLNIDSSEKETSKRKDSSEKDNTRKGQL